MGKKITLEEFIEQAQAVHGDRYDYSRVVYKNNSTKVEVVCLEHGSFFPKPINHIQNRSGCPACAGCKRTTVDDFIARARAVHGDRYDYSKVAYRGVDTLAEIICPDHGSFWQIPYDHTKGRGCKLCGVEKCAAANRRSLEKFIAAGRVKHGDRYDYSQVEYRNATTPVAIICVNHGVFWQTPCGHLAGYGCISCAGLNPIDQDQFIKRAQAVHGDRYDYSKVALERYNDPVEIICREHGSFWQVAKAHATGHGCSSCAYEQTTSKGEQELATWIESLGLSIRRNDRDTLKNLELDIFIPSKNLGIEYNGAYWHTDEKMPHPRLHEVKLNKAESAGIRIISIWDFDWSVRQEIIKSYLRYQLGMAGTELTYHARQGEIKLIGASIAADFYQKTHIQGMPKNALHYGLMIKNQLVACMSFSHGNSRRGKFGSNEWELTRYATGGIVRGGASRLFFAFVRDNNPAVVWSYSDRQHFSGNLYSILGFKEDGRLAADYRVFHQVTGRIWHKSAWQRKYIPTRLKELGLSESFDPSTDSRTEREMQKIARVLRIMDAGKIRWKWTN